MGTFVLGVLLLLTGLATLAVARRARRRASAPTPPGAEATAVSPPPESGPELDRWQQAAKAQRRRAPIATSTPTPAWFLPLAGWAMTGLGVLTLFLSTLYTQDVGEAIVLRTPGGTVAGVDITPGFSMKAPWNDIVKYDVRNQVITMAGEQGATDGPAINAQTSDNATAAVDITVRYSIVPAKVGDIYSAYRTQEGLVSRALDVDVRSIVRDVPVHYTAGELRQKRAQVSTDIAKELQTRWERLGVTVDSVDLRDIRYPQEIEQSLAAVQTARSRVESARAELESSKINAEKVKTEAQAQSDSDQIIRCGAMSTTVKEMIAGKEVASVKVVPVPPAQCQNRLNEQVLTSKYIDMLKEAAAKGNTMYVVPPSQSTLLQLPAPANAPAATPKR
ncbi:prohibitin family protein [Arsenicicoccus dermatophilus]|uniref:prohibitin family protein n=1 Tax=Arsenicicoccus dermatophilus TaxID=1076331 RepID=UPI001F4C76F1|nr:prohibitin family protein [Arsenicicoccus dermatophilus]MCH8613857.1 prohibitin family protein [Arsenicicoccus dermatophilus]